MQLGKVQRYLKMKPNFFSTIPTGNQTQGLKKTDFIFKFQEEILQERRPWHLETSTKTRSCLSHTEITLTLPLRSMFSLAFKLSIFKNQIWPIDLRERASKHSNMF